MSMHPVPLQSTSTALSALYSSVRPLFLPPPEEFVQPLLDSFVGDHDKVLEDNAVFTASTRLKEAAVKIDAVKREFSRYEGKFERDESLPPLDELRRARLRQKLQFQGGFDAEADEGVRKKWAERRSEVENECAEEEAEALKAFKEGLRQAITL